MSLVVTGLSADGNIDTIKVALAAAGFSLDALQVIAPDSSHEPLSRGIVGADIITSDTGTSMPGLNSRIGGRFFRNESIADRLGDLGIPDTEMDNYLEAVERGRSVVAYFAHADTIENAEAAFRSSGLANVRRF